MLPVMFIIGMVRSFLPDFATLLQRYCFFLTYARGRVIFFNLSGLGSLPGRKYGLLFVQ